MPVSPKRVKTVIENATDVDPEVILYMNLVYKVRESKKKSEADKAFEQILKLLDDKIKKIAGKFRIPGATFEDVYQEALCALKFKAIKDYNQDRGRDPSKPAPFDRFALLCIRRHLATTLKTSKQHRHTAMNTSTSLHVDRSDSSEEDLSLINIVCSTEGDILSEIQDKEYFRSMIGKLFSKLSPLEKQVFVLYARQYTYEEIAEFINKHSEIKNDVDIKGVDNALSRIKDKGDKLFKRYDPEGWERAKKDRKAKRSDNDMNSKSVDNALCRIKDKGEEIFKKIDPEGWEKSKKAKKGKSK